MKLKLGKLTTLENLPKGSLFLHGNTIGFKSEYGDNNGRIDAYILGSGEFFWGGTNKPMVQRKLPVAELKLKIK